MADGGWHSFGVAAEIIATVCENVELKIRPERITLPDLPAPANRQLESAYYIKMENIVDRIRKMLRS